MNSNKEDNIINRMPFSAQKSFDFRQYIQDDGIEKTPHDEYNYMSEVFKNFESINSKHRFIHSYFRNVHEAALTKLSMITQLKNVTLLDSSEASFNYILTEDNFQNQDRLAMFLDSGNVDKITLMMYSLAIIFEASLTDSTKNIYIMFELPKDAAMYNMCKMALTQVCGEVTIVDKGKISKSRSELDKPDSIKDNKIVAGLAKQRKVDELVADTQEKQEDIITKQKGDGNDVGKHAKTNLSEVPSSKRSSGNKERYDDEDQSLE